MVARERGSIKGMWRRHALDPNVVLKYSYFSWRNTAESRTLILADKIALKRFESLPPHLDVLRRTVVAECSTASGWLTKTKKTRLWATIAWREAIEVLVQLRKLFLLVDQTHCVCRSLQRRRLHLRKI